MCFVFSTLNKRAALSLKAALLCGDDDKAEIQVM